MRLTTHALSLLSVCALACATANAQGTSTELRTQMAAALSMITSYRSAIGEVFATTGRLPEKYNEIGMLGPMKSFYVDSKLFAEGVVSVTFSANANELLRGKTIKLVPMVKPSPGLVFYCLAPAVPDNLRPLDCL
jgi:hypothetical protein